MKAIGSSTTTGRAIPGNLKEGYQLTFTNAEVHAELADAPETDASKNETRLLLKNVRLALKHTASSNGNGKANRQFRTRKDGLTEITLGSERVLFEFNELLAKSVEDLKLSLQETQAELARREAANSASSSK